MKQKTNNGGLFHLFNGCVHLLHTLRVYWERLHECAHLQFMQHQVVNDVHSSEVLLKNVVVVRNIGNCWTHFTHGNDHIEITVLSHLLRMKLVGLVNLGIVCH